MLETCCLKQMLFTCFTTLLLSQSEGGFTQNKCTNVSIFTISKIKSFLLKMIKLIK